MSDTTMTRTPMTDYPIPTAETAEAALLGALILTPDARQGVAGTLTADDFSRDAHRTVYAAVMGMHEAGGPVDGLTVTDRLATSGKLDEVGGPLGVSDLCDVDTCPNPAAWSAYRDIVAREARRRRGIATLTRALQRLEAGEDPAMVAAELAVRV